MSLDRLLFVLSHKWRSMFKPKHAAYICLGCTLVFVVGNLNSALNYGETVNVNGSTIVLCSFTGSPQTSWMPVWDIVSFRESIYNKCALNICP